MGLPQVRFRLEQIYLTDSQGRPIVTERPVAFFHTLDASSVDEAVENFVHSDAATLIGPVQKFPGFQGIATVRRQNEVYTLQLGPASDRLPRLNPGKA